MSIRIVFLCFEVLNRSVHLLYCFCSSDFQFSSQEFFDRSNLQVLNYIKCTIRHVVLFGFFNQAKNGLVNKTITIVNKTTTIVRCVD